MRKKINKRISLITLMAFFIGILSTGIPMATNAETSSNLTITNSEKPNYGLAINTDGTVAVVELKNYDVIARRESRSSIGRVISDVSDKEKVPVGTVVTLSTTTTGASIIYTLDESKPTTGSCITYSSPITIGEDVTIKACVYKDSAYGKISEFNYKVDDGSAVQEEEVGVVSSDVSDKEEVLMGTLVTLSTTTTGGAIIYTLDGTKPTIKTGESYESPIEIKDDVTIKARVYKESTYGKVSQFDYKVLKVEEVQASLPSSTVTTSTSIELSTTTTDAAIYYEIEELDFNTTTTSQAIQYSGPINIESSKKITAYAVKEGYKDSIKSEFTYTMENRVSIMKDFDDEVIAGEFSMFKMKVKNILSEQKSVNLVIAVYDEKDRMIDYISVSDVLKPADITEIQCGLRISQAGSYVKSYVIDNLNGLVPLSNTIKIPVKSKE